ncbi:NAD(P)-dependent oxidoreductase [Rhizobium sp. GCM10022189]|uniref:NAD(P)-dependent oxidoreductase n=1 Tax=Rhizobium sp. GCM10022189 TaxID=3252654 RepID=UPI0036118117
MGLELQPGDKIAFLGVGQMGVYMADRLAQAGYNVVGWTRTPRNRDGSPRFEMAKSANDAIKHAKAVIVCLRDEVAVHEALFKTGNYRALDAGAIVIDMGTSGPEAARLHDDVLGTVDVAYLDAPVSGGTVGAREGTLSIFVGGTQETFGRVRSMMRSMGNPFYIGKVGSGQAAKLANQIIVGVTIAAVAEGLAYAESRGIDPGVLLEALEGGFAGSRVLKIHGPRMAARDYSAPGAVRLHLKDLRLAAMSDGLDQLPHARLVKAGFERLSVMGQDGLDHSAYAKLYHAVGDSDE